MFARSFILMMKTPHNAQQQTHLHKQSRGTDTEEVEGQIQAKSRASRQIHVGLGWLCFWMVEGFYCWLLVYGFTLGLSRFIPGLGGIFFRWQLACLVFCLLMAKQRINVICFIGFVQWETHQDVVPLISATLCFSRSDASAKLLPVWLQNAIHCHALWLKQKLSFFYSKKICTWIIIIVSLFKCSVCGTFNVCSEPHCNITTPALW